MDKTNQVSFPALASEVDGRLEVEADFEIDRTRWGIDFSSGSIFQQLGDKAIKDEIGFGLDLVFESAI